MSDSKSGAWSIGMTFICAGAAAAGLAGTVCAEPPTSSRLTQQNFTEVAKGIVDLFDMRMLAMANLVIVGPLAPTGVHRVSIHESRPPAIYSFRAVCPAGGTVTGAITDADRDDTMSTGDSFAANFHLCRVSVEGEVFTGSSQFEVTQHVIDESFELTEFQYRFDRLGTESLRWDGSAHVTMREARRTGADQVVVDYLDLAVDRWAQPWRWSFRLDIWRSPLGVRTARLDGRVSVGQLALLVEQQEPFVFSSGTEPRAGRLITSDPGGNQLRIDGGENGYLFSWRAADAEATAP